MGFSYRSAGASVGAGILVVGLVLAPPPEVRSEVNEVRAVQLSTHVVTPAQVPNFQATFVASLQRMLAAEATRRGAYMVTVAPAQARRVEAPTQFVAAPSNQVVAGAAQLDAGIPIGDLITQFNGLLALFVPGPLQPFIIGIPIIAFFAIAIPVALVIAAVQELLAPFLHAAVAPLAATVPDSGADAVDPTVGDEALASVDRALAPDALAGRSEVGAAETPEPPKAPTDEAAPVESEPVESEPVGTDPIDAAPIDVAPIDAAPLDAPPVDTEESEPGVLVQDSPEAAAPDQPKERTGPHRTLRVHDRVHRDDDGSAAPSVGGPDDTKVGRDGSKDVRADEKSERDSKADTSEDNASHADAA